MLNFLAKVLTILEKLVTWWTGRKRAREANRVRKAIATHDREDMNAIIQERRTK